MLINIIVVKTCWNNNNNNCTIIMLYFIILYIQKIKTILILMFITCITHIDLHYFIHKLLIYTEEVIWRKLLIDGDGIGDDRRLNILLKSYLKWCNTKYTDPTERYNIYIYF